VWVDGNELGLTELETMGMGPNVSVCLFAGVCVFAVLWKATDFQDHFLGDRAL
jgi:hypothetical protein